MLIVDGKPAVPATSIQLASAVPSGQTGTPGGGNGALVTFVVPGFLVNGNHTLAASGVTDEAGNVASFSSVYSWTVDSTELGLLAVSNAPSGRINSRTAYFTLLFSKVLGSMS